MQVCTYKERLSGKCDAFKRQAIPSLLKSYGIYLKHSIASIRQLVSLHPLFPQAETMTRISGKRQPKTPLTQCCGEPLRLVVMNNGHTESVQGNNTEDSPVETLCFHHASDEESEHLLFPAEVGGALVLATLQAGPGKWRPWVCEG